MYMAIGISRSDMDQDVEDSLRILPRGLRTGVDLGCGMGKLGTIAKRVFPSMRIVGVDGNPDIISALKRGHGSQPYAELKLALVQDALREIPRSDIIMAGDVLEHLPEGVLDEVLECIRAKCTYALIIGPEQNEDELERSVLFRSELPSLEHHLSLLRGNDLARKFGQTRWLSRKDTTNAQGGNPYVKFCLLSQCST